MSPWSLYLLSAAARGKKWKEGAPTEKNLGSFCKKLAKMEPVETPKWEDAAGTATPRQINATA
jgi:hypothetical protein